MGMGAVPQQWRVDRCVYEVIGQGDGWWIDVEHPDSLSVLEATIEPTLIRQGVRSLTTAVLRGENRIVTTAVGMHLRGIELFDGSVAHGLQFGSKHGGGWCRAACGCPAQRTHGLRTSSRRVASRSSSPTSTSPAPASGSA